MPTTKAPLCRGIRLRCQGGCLLAALTLARYGAIPLQEARAWSQGPQTKRALPRHIGSSKDGQTVAETNGALHHSLTGKGSKLRGLQGEALEIDTEAKGFKETSFLGTYGVYASAYLARNNAAVAKVPLLAVLGTQCLHLPYAGEAAWDITTASVQGALDAFFLLAYTLGCFILPALLDIQRRNPWEIVWSALKVIGFTQLALCVAWQGMVEQGLSLGLVALAIAGSAANGAAQSLLYPLCKQLVAEAYGADGAVLGLWNTCYYFGAVGSTLLAAALTDAFGWQAAFVGPGLLLIACGMAGGASKIFQARSGPTAFSSQTEQLMDLLCPPEPQLRLIAGQYFVVKLVRYAFGLWLPVLLAFGHATSGGSPLLEAVGSAALFDLGSMAGSLMLGKLSKEVGSEALPMMVGGCSATLAMLMGMVPSLLGHVEVLPMAVGALLLLLGVATGGGETLLGSISPIVHAKESSKMSVATAVSSVNGYGSLGTVVAAIAMPMLASGGDMATLPEAFGKLAPLCWLAAAAAAYQVSLQKHRGCTHVE
mmetsp:Transcript_50106/g.117084  ORF Transcript_50106/g.117084 Transcript_50106/m.117084 type:complete len:539 (-) Transcript_50106:130-1746(-)